MTSPIFHVIGILSKLLLLRKLCPGYDGTTDSTSCAFVTSRGRYLP